MGNFRPNGKAKHYQIPVMCLYNRYYNNLIAAGRMISASDDGWEVSRVIPVCALTGQAARSMADLIVLNNIEPAGIDVKPTR